MTTDKIKSFFRNHGLFVAHICQIVILSISLPLFDFIREWLVITKLYSTENFAWGSLFLFPVLQSTVAYVIVWYSEEIKGNNFSLIKIGMWRCRTWITLFLVPVYPTIRSCNLFLSMLGARNKGYKTEKLRISKRLMPIELFCESLPQLLILNYVLSGIVDNCPDCLEAREILEQTTFVSGFRQNIYKAILSSSVTINETFASITIFTAQTVYDKDEVEVIKDQLGYLVLAWYLLIVSSVLGLIVFLLEGPIPIMLMPTHVGGNALTNKGFWSRLKNISKVPEDTYVSTRSRNVKYSNNSVKKQLLILVTRIRKILGVLVYYPFILFSRCNSIYGMLRLISQFTVILSISYVSDSTPTNQELRTSLWLRVLLFLILNFLPAIFVQYLALLRNKAELNTRERVLEPFSYLGKFPFIFFVPVYTGILYTVDTSKRLRLDKSKKQSDVHNILIISKFWRTIFQVVRVVITTTMLIVIFAVPSLKTQHPEHVCYIILVNIFDVHLVLAHILTSHFRKAWCKGVYGYPESFQVDYNGDYLPTAFFHLPYDQTYQMTWYDSLLSLNPNVVRCRHQNKLHLKFWYKVPDKRIDKEAIKRLAHSPISEQFEREGYHLDLTSPKTYSIKEKVGETSEYLKDKFWHEWLPKHGIVPMETVNENFNGPALLFANEDFVFVPMEKEDIIHYFDSNNRKRLKDVISRIGLDSETFYENDCDYLEKREFSEDTNGVINMEIKNHGRYRYLTQYSSNPDGNLLRQTYTIYCPIAVCKGNF